MAYVEVLASGVKFDAPMDETYAKLGMDPSDVTSLEENLEEYFSKILKKLKEVGGQIQAEGFLPVSVLKNLLKLKVFKRGVGVCGVLQ